MPLLPHLLDLGLTEKEAKLYITLLEVGTNAVSSVARKAGVTRTTAYAALETLKEKGLVSIVERRGIQQFTAVKPEKLKDYAKTLREKAQKNYEKIQEILPTLKSLTGGLVMAPKVQYFEGIEGIKIIYEDTIETLAKLPKAERIKCSYSSAPQVSNELRHFLDEYILLRKKNFVRMRGIFPEGERSREYQTNAKENFAEVLIMPSNISLEFESEVNVYGNKFSIMSLQEDRLHGVIIESPEIASTQRSLFEIIWRASKVGRGL
ncbi:MAG: helix-turn-helix domain-containing protein [Candidatus Gracilibacteria bacterium]|nr:helix-turn-helix domain-containing protein [bacterium]MDZ4217259.1 helix-turn-helix domain-containing protein [Candidatus Gracilibacteria bacterium]